MCPNQEVYVKEQWEILTDDNNPVEVWLFQSLTKAPLVINTALNNNLVL